MAELQFPNIAGNILASYQQGQQTGRANRFRELAGQAIGARPQDRDALLQQAVAVDPDAGFALQEKLNADTDRRQRQIYNLARGFKQIHGQNPQAAMTFFQRQIAPGLGQLGFEVDPNTAEADILPVVDQVLAAFDPTATQPLTGGAREFQYLTQGLSDEDVTKARRVELGLDPRAVTGAAKNITVKGADGIERQGFFDPTTRQTFVLDEAANGFRPLGGGERISAEPAIAPGPQQVGQTRINLEGIDPAVSQRIGTVAEAMRQSGFPDDQIDAWVNQQIGAANTAAQSTTVAEPAPVAASQAAPPAPARLGVGRSPEAEAAAVEAAKQQAQIAAIPARGAAEAQAAGRKAAAETTAKGEAEKALTLRAELPNLRTTRNSLQDALTGFRNGTYTSGVVVGNIPAQFQSPANQYLLTTINDQILSTAERMKGTLSDKDVSFLEKTNVNLKNQPEANVQILQRKLQIIDEAIARAEGGGQAAPAPAARADRPASPQIKGLPRPTTQAEYDRLPSGALFIDPEDGKTYRK